MSPSISPSGTSSSIGAFFDSLIRPEPRPYHERAALTLPLMRALLAGVGNPHQGLACIHIAGSKGKGSTAHLCEAILEAAGLRTGMFTSPHLERWNERFRIAGTPASDALLDEVVARLRPAVEALRDGQTGTAPSFFAAMTAAAFMAFRHARVDCAIIEAGIGARHDATNVVSPMAACITTVEREHTDKLGADLRDIAWEKAGVVKPGIPTVAGRLGPAPMQVVRDCARACHAPLAVLGEDFTLERDPLPDRQRVRIAIAGARIETTLGFPGLHLAEDAALAVACVHASGLVRDALPRAAAEGLRSARLPARCEILAQAPWIIVDAAHTEDSLAALEACLRALSAGPRLLVTSLSGTERLRALAPRLARLAHRIVVTRADPERSVDPRLVAAALEAWTGPAALVVQPDPRAALRSALAALAPDGLLCVAGSVYMAGLGRRLLREWGADEGRGVKS